MSLVVVTLVVYSQSTEETAQCQPPFPEEKQVRGKMRSNIFHLTAGRYTVLSGLSGLENLHWVLARMPGFFTQTYDPTLKNTALAPRLWSV